MTEVLVTGATGNIGSKVVRDLHDRGVSVRVFVRDPDRAAGALGHDADVTIGDLADPDAVRVAMKGIDAVFLACGNDPLQVEYETNVIDAAADLGATRIVKLSAIGAEVDSPLAFWDSHGRIERRLCGASVPAVILRPAFSMSNLLASVESIKHAGQFFLPAGDAAVAMIDPSDVASAATVALTENGHDGRVYRLTGPAAITFDDVAAQLSLAIGRTVTYVDVPDAAARGSLVESGVPAWFADNVVTLFGLMRDGAGDTVTDDFRALTGRQPRPFADFARDHAALFGSVMGGRRDDAPRRARGECDPPSSPR